MSQPQLQPQYILNLAQLGWVEHKNGFEHQNQHSPTPPKLNFHQKDPQINLWCCLSNNINIKDNDNNDNNINNDKNNNNNNNNNNHKTKLG